MKVWKKIPFIMAAVILAAYFTTGCGDGSQAVMSDMDTISVKKDGTIEQTIIDEFEKDYYSIDELTAKAQEKIESFSDGTDNIIFKSAEEKNGLIIVKMIYKAGEDYTQFNKRELFYGTVSEASAKGFPVKNVFAQDGTALEDIEQIWRNHVIIIQTKSGEELNVNVYGKILYASGNVTWSGKNDVVITGETDTVSYIVFK